MSDRWFAKKPCKHCPFLRDVKPFLHPHRAAELAGLTQNKYSEFLCHKTLDHDDDSDEGEMLATRASLVCAGFLSMQIDAGARCPDGFTPSADVYADPYEMEDAYEEEWNSRRATR